MAAVQHPSTVMDCVNECRLAVRIKAIGSKREPERDQNRSRNRTMTNACARANRLSNLIQDVKAHFALKPRIAARVSQLPTFRSQAYPLSPPFPHLDSPSQVRDDPQAPPHPCTQEVPGNHHSQSQQDIYRSPCPNRHPLACVSVVPSRTRTRVPR
jgi:hypothetical protein